MKRHVHYHAHDSGAHAHEHGDGHHGAPFGRKVVFVGEDDEDLTPILEASINEVRRRKGITAASTAAVEENNGTD